jgi:hypothetical protein
MRPPAVIAGVQWFRVTGDKENVRQKMLELEMKKQNNSKTERI